MGTISRQATLGIYLQSRSLNVVWDVGGSFELVLPIGVISYEKMQC